MWRCFSSLFVKFWCGFFFQNDCAVPKKTWFKMIAVPKKTWCPSNFVFAELENFSDLYFVTAWKGSIRLTKFCCKFFKVAINSGPTNKAINKTFWEHPIFVTHPVRFKITYIAFAIKEMVKIQGRKRNYENLRKDKEEV